MGSGTMQGRLWGARAEDWADIQEGTVRPAYEAVLDDLAPLGGTALLDIGCGAGGFAALASARGASITGLDAAQPLLTIAERRVPQGTFLLGEMEQLPYPDGTFNIATGINSFQYAADPARAMAEAARVVHVEGKVVAMTWGTAPECEASAYLAALGALLPPPPPGAPGPFALSEPDALEALLRQAKLNPGPRRIIPCDFQYPNRDTAVRGLLSAGPAVRAIEHSGLAAVTNAIEQVLAAFQRPDGSYLLRNTFHYIIAVR